MSASRVITAGLLVALWLAGLGAALWSVFKQSQQAAHGAVEAAKPKEPRPAVKPSTRPDAGAPKEPTLTATITVEAFPPPKTQLVSSVAHLLRGQHTVTTAAALAELEAADAGAPLVLRQDVKHLRAHLEFHEQLPGPYTVCVVSSPGKLFGCGATTVTGMVPVVEVRLKVRAEAPPAQP